jgi:hypothetical protein
LGNLVLWDQAGWPPAGISLGATGLAAAPLVAAFVLFPQQDRLIGGLTVIYFGFLFVNSSIKIQRGSYSLQGFSPVLSVILLIAIAYLMVTIINEHQEKPQILPQNASFWFAWKIPVINA